MSSIPFPAGLEPGETLSTKLGEVAIARGREPAIFWVRARGIITPPLLRQDLARAEQFGTENPAGWSYVVDVSAVRLAHPGNVLELRRIVGLPHLERYVVVTSSRLQRLLLAAGRRFVSADAIVATPEEAMAQIRRSRSI